MSSDPPPATQPLAQKVCTLRRLDVWCSVCEEAFVVTDRTRMSDKEDAICDRCADNIESGNVCARCDSSLSDSELPTCTQCNKRYCESCQWHLNSAYSLSLCQFCAS